MKLPLNLADPLPLNLGKPEIFIVKDEGEPMMCMDVDGYKAMAVNMSDILHFIQSQNYIIERYRNYYEGQAGNIMKAEEALPK